MYHIFLSRKLFTSLLFFHVSIFSVARPRTAVLQNLYGSSNHKSNPLDDLLEEQTKNERNKQRELQTLKNEFKTDVSRFGGWLFLIFLGGGRETGWL